jgi:hypothetical protein
MTAIKLDPAGKKVTAEIVSNSLHVVGVELTVFDKAGNEAEKYKGGITQISSKVDFPLKNAASAYDGFEIQATSVFNSPNGDDNAPYSAVYQLLVDGQPVKPSITMNGNTKSGQATVTEIFEVTT